MLLGKVKDGIAPDVDPSTLATWINVSNAHNRGTIGPHNVQLVPYSSRGYIIRLLGHWSGYTRRDGQSEPPVKTADPFEYLKLSAGTLVKIQYCHTTPSGGSGFPGYVKVESLRFQVGALHGEGKLKVTGYGVHDSAGRQFNPRNIAEFGARRIPDDERGLDVSGLPDAAPRNPDPIGEPPTPEEQERSRVKLAWTPRFIVRTKVLKWLLENGPTTQSDLMVAIGSTQAAISAAVKVLRDAGYVSHRPRSHEPVSLTVHGKSVIEEFLHDNGFDPTHDEDDSVTYDETLCTQILEYLRDNGPSKQVELNKAIPCPTVTMSRTLLYMIANGLVTRKGSRLPCRITSAGLAKLGGEPIEDVSPLREVGAETPPKASEASPPPEPAQAPTKESKTAVEPENASEELLWSTERILVKEESNWFRRRKVWAIVLVGRDSDGNVVKTVKVDN